MTSRARIVMSLFFSSVLFSPLSYAQQSPYSRLITAPGILMSGPDLKPVIKADIDSYKYDFSKNPMTVRKIGGSYLLEVHTDGGSKTVTELKFEPKLPEFMAPKITDEKAVGWAPNAYSSRLIDGRLVSTTACVAVEKKREKGGVTLISDCVTVTPEICAQVKMLDAKQEPASIRNEKTKLLLKRAFEADVAEEEAKHIRSLELIAKNLDPWKPGARDEGRFADFGKRKFEDLDAQEIFEYVSGLTRLCERREPLFSPSTETSGPTNASDADARKAKAIE